MTLKKKVFILSLLLTLLLVTIFTWSELNRWRELNRSYTESKGITLVRTISPLVLDYINSDDKNKLTKLVKSITSLEIKDNDIISVQISDKSKNKIVEAAPKTQYRHGPNFYFPPSVVIENPLVDIEKDEEIGFIQVVFSNDYFISKTTDVLKISLLALIIGCLLSYYISRVVVKHIEKPLYQLTNIVEKVSEGNSDVDVYVDNFNESLPFSTAFEKMLGTIKEQNKNLVYKNIVQEQKIYEMTALKQINHSLCFVHDIDEIYVKLVENVLNVLNGIQSCIVLVVDELHGQFEYKVVKGLNTESIAKNKRVPIDSLIASKVYQTGETLVINETSTKTIEAKEEDIKSSDKAENDIADSDKQELENSPVISKSNVDKSFYMPIIVKGKVIAILSGKNKLSGEDFSQADLSLVEGIIKETTISISNALMWQDLHRKVIELNTLHEIAKNIGVVLDINKLLELILDLTSKVFGAVKNSSIILYDEETQLLNVKLYKGDKSCKNIKPIKSGEGIAGKVFQRGEPIIINDMHTTEDNDSIDNGSSSICVPLKVKEKCLGVLSITDKISGEPFDKSDLDMMVTLASQIAVSLNNAKLYEDLEASYLSAVRALANSIDAKDTYTMGHSERVAKYSVEIGKRMGLSDEELKNLYIGALLHDIGKIGIPEAIINKTDKLTNEEFQEIKTHPTRGATIIEPAKFLKEKVPLIKYHHERFDGKGYPEGLKGEEIPLLARIICCADSFDAMTSKRAYRDTMPIDFAKKELIRCSETQFDPKIVSAFLEVIANEDIIQEIKMVK